MEDPIGLVLSLPWSNIATDNPDLAGICLSSSRRLRDPAQQVPTSATPISHAVTIRFRKGHLDRVSIGDIWIRANPHWDTFLTVTMQSPG
jgi:hypothetical protein